MKKITLLLLTLTILSCNQKERDCTDFRTGKFKFVQDINGKKHTSTFVRTENIQIETYNGKTDSASVRWVNDCEFILQKLHPKSMEEEKAISMKILYTEKNSYTFEYSFVGSNKKQRGSAIKVD
ncbi:DNA topoisomerase IV [Flavobacterium sp.]|uniref:DNA topoisomerase IV n=1 Tax=Flavobacterium sp. TaxID=239 RepID=UPI002487CB7D|nr:DNA topoisomerase IV [Flavobacterium sp.]MDI1316615.1 DNA topoisomerase IV [Flavobacterium sp.]